MARSVITRRPWAIAALAVAIPAVGHAQDRSGEGSPNGQIEEIIVTAQKRTENLQSVPVSAQVIGGEVLSERNLNSLQTLTQTTPGVNIVRGALADVIYIRGVGAGNNQSFDQPVATFIDDIYHGRSRTSSAAFLDLDRVEILKGPQSIYFGNNAIAGALNIVTTKPGDRPEGFARALYGTHGNFSLEAADTAPLSDTLSVRLAATYTGSNGWLKDVVTGKHAPSLSNVAGRATVRYSPTSDLDATLKVEASTNSQKGSPFQITNCTSDLPGFAAYLAKNGQGCAVAAARGYPIGLDNNQSAGPAGQKNRLRTAESVLTLNYHLADQTITSVTGYTHQDIQLALDQYQAGPSLITASFPEHTNQFSQELRLASTGDQRIEYLAGGYFQSTRTATEIEVNFPGFSQIFGSIAPQISSFLPLAYDERLRQSEQVFALFGALTWNVTNNLKVTGGLRLVSDHKKATASSDYGTAGSVYGGYIPGPPSLQPIADRLLGYGFGTPVTTGSFARTDKAALPSAKLQYQFLPALMAYASYSRGFLGGGFNGQDTSGNAASVAFSPEFVDAYELGLKSKFLHNSILLNIAAFRSDYSDLQVTAITRGSGVNLAGTIAVRNAASSRSQGVEVEAQWAVNSNFRLGINVTYLDAYFVDYADGPPTGIQNAQGITSQNLSGRRTPYSPKWSGSMSAAYLTPVFGKYQFRAELTPFYSDAYFSGVGSDPLGRQKAYTRLDGRLTFENVDARWAIDIIGKNLTDKVIMAGGGSPTASSKQEPINVAAQFRYKW